MIIKGQNCERRERGGKIGGSRKWQGRKENDGEKDVEGVETVNEGGGAERGEKKMGGKGETAEARREKRWEMKETMRRKEEATNEGEKYVLVVKVVLGPTE